MDGGDPYGVVEDTAVPSGEGGEPDRGVRGPERRGAQVGDIGTERLGDDAGRDHAGGLALVVRGADGGVALDVLDRPQPGTGGTQDVGDGRVALEVDEARAGAPGSGSVPTRAPSSGSPPAPRPRRDRRRPVDDEAELGQRLRGRTRPVRPARLAA